MVRYLGDCFQKMKKSNGWEMRIMNVAENYKRIRGKIPEHVSIVVAAKTITAAELSEIIDAGATDIGENYVQEAFSMHEQLAEKIQKVRWHLIRPLQKR